MPLVNLAQILEPANNERYAVAAFDVFNIEMAAGVMKAAEKTHSPVILAYVEVFDTLIPMEAFIASLNRLAADSSVPVCIHLDHATNFTVIQRAVKCGFTSVMIDASDRAFEENIAATRQVVQLCQPLNVSVEAELGHVAGNEGMYSSDQGFYTEVDQAKEFVDRTMVDALAVAVGTVHGVYKSTPILSFDRCAAIKNATNNLPLVLHGGSGLSDEDFYRIINCGINKVNIFTDLTLAALAQLRVADLSGGKAYFAVCAETAAAVQSAAEEKLQRFGCVGKA
jgi:fructose-bisphosphate aldolase class II